MASWTTWKSEPWQLRGEVRALLVAWRAPRTPWYAKVFERGRHRVCRRTVMIRGRRIAAAAGLGVLVASLAVAAWLLRPAETPQGPTVDVDMTAARYFYDPGNFTVQQGATVVVHLTSTDVTHGFAIPELGVDVRIPPGETVTVTFAADRAGTFEYFCTVFCGSGHPQHRGRITVTA